MIYRNFTMLSIASYTTFIFYLLFLLVGYSVNLSLGLFFNFYLYENNRHAKILWLGFCCLSLYIGFKKMLFVFLNRIVDEYSNITGEGQTNQNDEDEDDEDDEDDEEDCEGDEDEEDCDEDDSDYEGDDCDEDEEEKVVLFKTEPGMDETFHPTLGEPFAVGHDLTAVSVWKKVGDTTFYETGISVEPPEGYYLEIVPRSSISKTGHILANSVGVIDPDYRGTLKIPVMHVDKSLPALTTPFTLFQMVCKKHEKFRLVFSENLSNTTRGDGGFGSTNKT